MSLKRFWTDREGHLSLWKDPDDVETFFLDFSRLVGSSSVSSATVTTNDNVTIDSSSVSSNKVTFTLSGDPGDKSEITIQATLADGQKKSRTVNVYGREA